MRLRKGRQADARQVTGHHCAVPVGAGSSDPSEGSEACGVFAGNPYYELPEKQACEPIAAAGSLAEVSAEEAAKRFAAALFAADNDPRAFVNSAEIFSKQVKTRILGDNGTDVCYYKNDVDGESSFSARNPRMLKFIMHSATTI